MSTAIVERAKAKVNLALHVLGRRADGYHELDSIVGFKNIVPKPFEHCPDQLAPCRLVIRYKYLCP